MNETPSAENKPRMLFLSGPWDHLETVRKVGLVDPVTRLLEHHFDLVTVAGDQNYGDVVEAHQPDIVMFDSGCDTFQGRTPVFTNTQCHPEVPKVGFIRQDFHSPMRLSSYGRMDAWGVEQYFSPSYPYRGAPRAWRDRVIFIPRWVDTEYFRDWGETKCIPIAMLGAGFFSSSRSPSHLRQYRLGSGGIEDQLEYALGIEGYGYVAAVSRDRVAELAPGYEGGGAGYSRVLVDDHAFGCMPGGYA